jgi:hypothetical protein
MLFSHPEGIRHARNKKFALLPDDSGKRRISGDGRNGVDATLDRIAPRRQGNPFPFSRFALIILALTSFAAPMRAQTAAPLEDESATVTTLEGARARWAAERAALQAQYAASVQADTVAYTATGAVPHDSQTKQLRLKLAYLDRDWSISIAPVVARAKKRRDTDEKLLAKTTSIDDSESPVFDRNAWSPEDIQGIEVYLDDLHSRVVKPK